MSHSRAKHKPPVHHRHRDPHRKYIVTLGCLYAIIWIVLAINPIDRQAWLLENVLVFFGVGLTWFLHQRLPFSRVSLTLIFVYVCFHTLGSHYTYSLVPYDAWIQNVFGFSLNEFMGWERNHYDRLVHFLYGFLLAYPIRELFFRVADTHGFWGYFFPFDVTMSTSMLFELFEWWTTEIFASDLGQAYVGAQGDVWDAHKDMLLASAGAFLAMFITLIINWRTQKDFAREWSQSFTIKRWRPLGEDELIRRLHQENRGDHGSHK